MSASKTTTSMTVIHAPLAEVGFDVDQDWGSVEEGLCAGEAIDAACEGLIKTTAAWARRTATAMPCSGCLDVKLEQDVDMIGMETVSSRAQEAQVCGRGSVAAWTAM